MKEIWKNVEGWEKYFVSNEGRIKSLKWETNGRIRKPSKSSFGYLIIILKNKPIVKGYGVHQLVARAFIPNPLNKKCVNHKDGNKLNNRVDNLEWVTYKENVKHAINTGLNIFKGEDNPNAKLKKENVSFIRNSTLSSKKLAKMFNVSQPTISTVRTRHNWDY